MAEYIQLDIFGNPILPIDPNKKSTKKVVFENRQVSARVKTPKATAAAPPPAESPVIMDEEIDTDSLPTDAIYEEPIEEQEEEIVVAAESEEKIIPTGNTQVLVRVKGKRGRKSYAETYASVEEINVPSAQELKQKLYYSISEVASWFKVTASQIRFWESEFDILKPRKNRKGDRLFRVEDINNLKTIYYLLRNRKFSIEGAKEYLRANKNSVLAQQQVKETLTQLKGFLLELKANLEVN